MNLGSEFTGEGEQEDRGAALGVVGEALEGDEGGDEKGEGFAGAVRGGAEATDYQGVSPRPRAVNEYGTYLYKIQTHLYLYFIFIH
jgi:hypothetical protein